jgi:hypothetical protein
MLIPFGIDEIQLDPTAGVFCSVMYNISRGTDKIFLAT